MAVISGVDGTITNTNGYVTKVRSWTINIAGEDVDTTALGDRWKSHQSGLQEWSGTYEAEIDATALGTCSTTDYTLGNLEFGGTGHAATFSWSQTGTRGQKFSGTIITLGVDASVGVEAGAGTLTFTFVGSGALSMEP